MGGLSVLGANYVPSPTEQSPDEPGRDQWLPSREGICDPPKAGGALVTRVNHGPYNPAMSSAPRTPGPIGQPLRRKEDDHLLRGQGRFSDDFSLPGQGYAAMVRSPHPHARIVAIEADEARAIPGVLGVFTGADIAREGLGAIPHRPLPSNRYDLKLRAPGGGAIFIGPHLLLPADKARHVGEAVAMVVAETRAQAEDASEAVRVSWAPLPFVVDAAEAAEGRAPAVWDEVPTNVCVDTAFGSDAAAVDRAFAEAAHVVARDFHVGRVTGVPIEPRAALGVYDAASGRYLLDRKSTRLNSSHRL